MVYHVVNSSPYLQYQDMARSDKLVISKSQNFITSTYNNKKNVKILFNKTTAIGLIKRNFYNAIGLERLYNIDEKSIIILTFVGNARKIKAKPAISGN